MQRNLFDEQIIEVSGISNTAFILKNTDMFYDIGFRVMKNQKNGSILDCHHLKYNGKIKFVFFTDELTRLSDLLLRADADHVMNLVSNLIRAIEEIQSNGFLNVACVDSRLDHIFVDNRTLAVKMIYLPINIPMNGMLKSEFESSIRTQLIKLIQGLPQSENAKLCSLVNILMDGNLLTLSEVAKKIQVNPIAMNMTQTVQANVMSQAEVISVQPTYETPSANQMTPQTSFESIVLASATGKQNISITKPVFKIGKSAERADGVIAGNPAISRAHCEIRIQDGVIWIQDIGSANGTFVNGQRLQKEQLVQIQLNDRIRIANEEYIVRR